MTRGVLALDTNVVIDLGRGDEVVRHNYDLALGATPMCISAVVLQELRFGIERNPQRERERARLEPILAELEVLAFEPADAIVGGRTRAVMEAAGQRAPLGDFLVGVHALARGCLLVTANTRHFQNIPGLQLLDWRLPPEAQDASHA